MKKELTYLIQLRILTQARKSQLSECLEIMFSTSTETSWCMIKIFWGAEVMTPSKPPPPTNNFCLYPPPVYECFWKDPLMTSTSHHPTSSTFHCYPLPIHHPFPLKILIIHICSHGSYFKHEKMIPSGTYAGRELLSMLEGIVELNQFEVDD